MTFPDVCQIISFPTPPRAEPSPNPFSPGDNCVLMETRLGTRKLTRERVETMLEDYRNRHDELLRSGRVIAIQDAREIRTLWTELSFVGSLVWAS
jgi:hypothetical protein